MDESLSPQIMNLSEIGQAVTERVEGESRLFKKTSPSEKPDISSEFILQCLDQNEDGDAALYIELQRGRFVYDHSLGRWYKYVEHYYEEDFLNQATEVTGSVINVYGEEARRQAWNRVKGEKAGQKDKAKEHSVNEAALLKRIRLLQTKARKENILSLARNGAASLGITGQEWDLAPMFLSSLNGVIDLQTAEHRRGKPEDFIRTIAPTIWKGLDELSPTWNDFLFEIFDRDTELIAYIQRLCGYCITGKTVEHILVILWGKGRNGRTTFLEVLKFVLGDYAGPIEAEFLLKQRFPKASGGPTSDIFALRGKRLVWASETDEGRTINAGKTKWVVGSDSLTGREMYGRKQISFRPTHKLFLITNHKPHAAADDYALWQRIHLIPFKKSFVSDPKEPDESKADPELPNKLKTEAPGILAWLVRGCLAWQQEGLNPPATVKIATEQYRQEEDMIKVFIDACCERKGDVQAGILYARYKSWCEENEIKRVSGVVFGKRIKGQFDSYEDRNRTFYVGLSVRGCE